MVKLHINSNIKVSCFFLSNNSLPGYKNISFEGLKQSVFNKYAITVAYIRGNIIADPINVTGVSDLFLSGKNKSVVTFNPPYFLESVNVQDNSHLFIKGIPYAKKMKIEKGSKVAFEVNNIALELKQNNYLIEDFLSYYNALCELSQIKTKDWHQHNHMTWLLYKDDPIFIGLLSKLNPALVNYLDRNTIEYPTNDYLDLEYGESTVVLASGTVADWNSEYTNDF